MSPTVGTRNEEFKLLKTLKKRLTKDGGSFVAMARLFKKMDLDGNGVVDLEEFEHAIETMDMMLSKEKVKMLFHYFDEDRNGSIDVDEFVRGVREPIFEQRILCNGVNCSYEPVRLAPGMKSQIELFLSAEVSGVCQCELRIVESSSGRIMSTKIKAYVVPQLVWKNVNKQMELAHNDPEYSMLNNNVKEIGRVITSYGEKEASMEEESALNDEEIEEIKHMPIVHGVYYDPFTKKMKYDEDLMKILINPDWTIAELDTEAVAMWSERYFQLEEKGMYTSDLLEREEQLMASRATSAANSFIIDKEDEEDEYGNKLEGIIKQINEDFKDDPSKNQKKRLKRREIHSSVSFAEEEGKDNNNNNNNNEDDVGDDFVSIVESAADIMNSMESIIGGAADDGSTSIVSACMNSEEGSITEGNVDGIDGGLSLDDKSSIGPSIASSDGFFSGSLMI